MWLRHAHSGPTPQLHVAMVTLLVVRNDLGGDGRDGFRRGPGLGIGQAVLDLGLGWHVVKDIVEELECAVQRDLDPTWRLLDALATVVRAPALGSGGRA